MPTTTAPSLADERAWWREHPDPQVTRTADRLILWNYPVAGTDLAPAHAAAVRFFLQNMFLSPARSAASVEIVGHASVTGEGNDAIARQRADKVAAHLRELGFVKVTATTSGDRQPADPGTSGQALARNRRVEVAFYTPSIEPEPRLPVEPWQPTPTGGDPPTGGGVAGFFEVPVEITIDDIDDGKIHATLTAIGKLKVKVSRGEAKNAEGIVLKGGKLSAKFEAELVGHLKGKLGFDPGGDGKPPSAKATIAGQVFGFPVESGFQTKPQFFTVSVTLGKVKVDPIELEGFTFELELELQVRIDIGPSPRLLVRLGISAGAPGIVAVGTIVGTVVVIAGCAYLVDEAKREGLQRALDVAERDGAAARVVYEAFGATKAAGVKFSNRRLEWSRASTVEADVRAAFEAGQSTVGTWLDGLGSGRTEKVAAWAAAYTAQANTEDFDKTCETVVRLFRPYDKVPPTVLSVLSDL
ncbi:hypothetical protein [Nocardioides zhouii]|uniref:OmpA-like domain-containing protein n=1 Tax=Nocardioides zhouii TaxID=1168729 RepID=A0A4Q2T7S8_9ACTN|nr:hypothetical protein [Nocardioides zhouii]RYC14862.1 hypothetical protein EUA94_01710 [Nocardioides zhouii]